MKLQIIGNSNEALIGGLSGKAIYDLFNREFSEWEFSSIFLADNFTIEDFSSLEEVFIALLSLWVINFPTVSRRKKLYLRVEIDPETSERLKEYLDFFLDKRYALFMGGEFYPKSPYILNENSIDIVIYRHIYHTYLLLLSALLAKENISLFDLEKIQEFTKEKVSDVSLQFFIYTLFVLKEKDVFRSIFMSHLSIKTNVYNSLNHYKNLDEFLLWTGKTEITFGKLVNLRKEGNYDL